MQISRRPSPRSPAHWEIPEVQRVSPLARPQLAVMHLCLGGSLLPPRRLEASSGALSGFGSAGGRGVGGDGGVDAKASSNYILFII